MRKTYLALLIVAVACLAAASFLVYEIGDGMMDVEAAGGGYPAADVYVDADADPGWYDATHVHTVQEGVDNASAGDTIFVYNGTYFENVEVNKQLTLLGEDRNGTIIDGGGDGDVVHVIADWVNISGFTVRGSGSDWRDAGIKLDSVQHCRIDNTTISNNSDDGIDLSSSCNDNTVSGNTIRNNWDGILLSSSCNDNTVSGNTITNNSDDGIDLSSSSNNTVSGNTVTNNSDDGIDLSSSCNDNTVSGNTITNNSDDGIDLSSSSNNTVSGNTITNNSGDGILLSSSSNNTVSGNTITNNNWAGIDLVHSYNCTVIDSTMVDDGITIYGYNIEEYATHTIDTSNNVNGKPVYYWKNVRGGTVPSGAGQIILANCTNVTVENQNVSNAPIGIQAYFSHNCTITNTTANKNWLGVWLKYSSNNFIYHNNFINNTQNAYDEGNNTWYNATLDEGNYWDDYNGSDTNSDGIGDQPYNISGGDNQDLYPLMEPWNYTTPPVENITLGYGDISCWVNGSRVFNITLTNTGTVNTTITNITVSENWIQWMTSPFTIDSDESSDTWLQMQVPADATTGTHTITFTIDTTTYGTIQRQLSIQIYEERSASVTVTVVDNETGSPLQNAMVMIDDNASLHYTNQDGQTSFQTTPGIHSFYAGREGYLLKETQAHIDIGDNTATIRLDPGEVMLVNVTAEPMNYSEISDAGVNVQDPDNYDFYSFSLDLFVEDHPLTDYDTWFETPSEGGGSWSGLFDGDQKHYVWVPKGKNPLNDVTIHYDDGSGTTGSYTYIGNLYDDVAGAEGEIAHAWVHIEGSVHVLKEFFRVSVEITNNADPSFTFTDITANITLPEGLSLPQLNGSAQPTTKTMDDIPGQTNGTTSWVVRGDKAGTYNLSVGVCATVMPFNVDITGSGQATITVYGTGRVQPVFMPARYVRSGIPFVFTMGIHNPTPRAAYNVSISLHNDALGNVILDDAATKYLGTIKPGQTKYAAWRLIPSVSGFVVLDASSVYTDRDGTLEPRLTFYDDTYSGATTALYIASQQVLNAEMHAFAGELTQCKMVYTTTSEDFLWHAINTASSGGIVGAYNLALSVADMAENVAFDSIFGDEQVKQATTEEQILENITRMLQHNVSVNLTMFDNHMTGQALSDWLYQDYNDTLHDVEGMGDLSGGDQEEVSDILHDLQVSARQNTVVEVAGNSSTLGTVYPLLFESVGLREKYDRWGTIGKLTTVGSLGFLLIPGGQVVSLMLTVGGAAIGTYQQLIKHSLVNVTGTSCVSYISDLDNFTRCTSNIFSFMDDMSNPTTFSAGTDSITVVNMSMPSIVIEDNCYTGSATGTITVDNPSASSRQVTGEVVIKQMTNGTPIVDRVPISTSIQASSTSTISFQYNVSCYPGMPAGYIAEISLSAGDEPLPDETSLFTATREDESIASFTEQGMLYDTSTIQYNLSLPPHSEMYVASATQGVELHLYGNSHLGMNYTAGVMDQEITGTYSGYLSSPQWLHIVNEDDTDSNYTVEIYGLNMPTETNYTLKFLAVNTSATPLVYPPNVTASINSNRSHLVLAYHPPYENTSILGVNISGNIIQAVSDIWWPSGNLSGGESHPIDITLAFPAAGSYNGTVNIFSETPYGMSNSTVTVRVEQNSLPVADAGFNQTVNETVVQLDASGSYDSDGNITDYRWDFGDGTVEHGMIFNHSFAQGVHVVTLEVTDDDGGVDSDTCTIIVDTTPPITTVTLSGIEGNNGWYQSPVSVALNATDNLTAVDYMMYRLDDGAWKQYNETIYVTMEGMHNLSFYSVDTAGNNEQISTNTFKIDATPPAIEYMIIPSTPGGDQGWYVNPVHIGFSTTDNISGLDSQYYQINDSQWQPLMYNNISLWEDGIYTIGYRALDKAGNNASIIPFTISIDGTPPNTNASLAGTAGNNGWYTGNVIVTLNAVDNTSGINITHYQIDDGDWQQYQDAFVVSGDGNHTIRYYSVDTAGNTELNETVMVAIDGTEPATAATADPDEPSGMHGWYTGEVMVELESTDTTAGVNTTSYRIDGGDWQNYTGPFSVAGDGNHTVEYYSVDHAGNPESSKEAIYRVDTTPPTTTLSLSGDGYEPWFSSDVEATVSASDSISRVNRTMYCLDDGEWQQYMGAFAVTSEGEHIIEYYSMDNAGINGSLASTSVYIDTTPPSVDILSPSGGNINGTVNVAWTASDTLAAAIDISIEYRPDGGSWQSLASGVANSGSYSWNTKSVDNGQYQLRLSASDDAGNMGTATSSTFTVDNPINSRPTVSIAAPTMDDSLSDNTTITGTASDSDGAVQKVEVRIDDGSWQLVDGTNSWSYTWDTRGVSDGIYTIEARSYDGEDYSTIASVTVTVSNNHPPTVVITSPQDGATVAESMLIRGNASDIDNNSTITKVEVKIDNGNWTEADGTVNWAYNLEPNTMGDGDHTIQVRAYDGTDYSDTESITITVETGEGGGIAGFEFVLLLAATIVATIISKKRRLKG